MLGASSFLGEKAFLGREPYGFSARARTAVDLTLIGQNVLTQLSARRDLGFAPQGLPAAVKRHVTLPIVNTRGVETGVTRAEGSLRF